MLLRVFFTYCTCIVATVSSCATVRLFSTPCSVIGRRADGWRCSPTPLLAPLTSSLSYVGTEGGRVCCGVLLRLIATYIPKTPALIMPLIIGWSELPSILSCAHKFLQKFLKSSMYWWQLLLTGKGRKNLDFQRFMGVIYMKCIIEIYLWEMKLKKQKRTVKTIWN